MASSLFHSLVRHTFKELLLKRRYEVMVRDDRNQGEEIIFPDKNHSKRWLIYTSSLRIASVRGSRTRTLLPARLPHFTKFKPTLTTLNTH